ncbi:MAG: hypothetical protein ACI9U0_001880 [Flavobacteriales bacterium]|jgi:hypothetical protein|tara:strand:+ start:3278 stop:3391 length:114 start_codon:yes stop_codon:yes gene_type:complete
MIKTKIPLKRNVSEGSIPKKGERSNFLKEDIRAILDL